MSASTYPEYPDDLKASAWEKDKKSGFDAKSDVADKLKALQKKHDAVDWKLFADGWAKSIKTAADLEVEGAKRHKVYTANVLPLKKEALSVASVAKAAEKKADKVLLATLKSIGKAVDAYASGVEQCADALKTAYEKAQDALPEEDDDEDSAAAALMNPKQLLKQLNLCRKDAERTMKFAYVDAKDKQPATLVLHPRMSGRALFAKLQAAAGVKTGAFGTAWVDGTALMLQLDKPLGGLVKKVRAPVRACGFKISKAVLWNEDGTVFEQDELPEDAPGDATAQAQAPGTATGTATPTPTSAGAGAQANQVDAGKAFKARLSAEFAGIQAVMKSDSANAASIREKFARMGELAKKSDFVAAQAALDEIGELMPAPGANGASTPGTTATDPKAAEVQRLRASLQDDFDALQRGPLDPTLRERFQPISTAWNAAQESTDKGLHDRALLILKKIADTGALAKLRQALGAGATIDAKSPTGKPAPSLVVLQKARLVWDGMRKSVQSQFSSIEGAVISAVRANNADPQAEEEYDESAVAARLKELFVSLDTMDQGLIDKLDEALSAEGPQRDARYAEASALIRQFRSFAAADPMLGFIDSNGFAPTRIRASVDQALAELGDQF